jgi:DNA-directed RNA polymerase subunit RPC12/RpoP
VTSLIALSCNHCGAPLDVPSGTRFVTCAHCGSRLTVSESDGAYVTAVLQELSDKTDRMDGVLRGLQLQQELERLDAEWAAHEERDDYPVVPLDDKSTGRMLGGLAVLCCFVGLIVAVVAGPSLAPLVLGAFGCLALLLLLTNLSFREGDRAVAERDYLARRVTLVRELRATELATNGDSESAASRGG